MNGQQNNPSKAGNVHEKDADTSALHFGDGTLQRQQEFKTDKDSSHKGEDNAITVSHIDESETTSDGAACTDMAGTAERKSYGDTELNKGLEAQAKDKEL